MFDRPSSLELVMPAPAPPRIVEFTEPGGARQAVFASIVRRVVEDPTVDHRWVYVGEHERYPARESYDELMSRWRGEPEAPGPPTTGLAGLTTKAIGEE